MMTDDYDDYDDDNKKYDLGCGVFTGEGLNGGCLFRKLRLAKKNSYMEIEKSPCKYISIIYNLMV